MAALPCRRRQGARRLGLLLARPAALTATLLLTLMLMLVLALVVVCPQRLLIDKEGHLRKATTTATKWPLPVCPENLGVAAGVLQGSSLAAAAAAVVAVAVTACFRRSLGKVLWVHLSRTPIADPVTAVATMQVV